MVEPLAAFDTFGIEDDDPDAAWRILALLHAVRSPTTAVFAQACAKLCQLRRTPKPWPCWCGAAWLRVRVRVAQVATVPRFGMTVQFLSKAEQCTVSTLFEKLTTAAAADGGGWDAERRKVLESARGSFGLVKKSL